MYVPETRTIVVPSDVRPEFIGEFVSDACRRIYNSLGSNHINPKSFRLVPLEPRIWALIYEGKGYELPKDLDIRGYTGDRSEPSEVGSSSVANRNQNRSRKGNTTGGTGE